jgi:L-glutamine:2-deoxy-scyllo-inosose/3-amino-2,3-dideoxy-scyllo-inosose aminotransferase
MYKNNYNSTIDTIQQSNNEKQKETFMKNELAINGGTKVFTAPPALPAWPPIFPETAEALAKAYVSGKWSFNGPVEQQFAKDFADFHTASYGIAMANGTVTLESALTALGIEDGDEVIVPALTWIATAMAVLYTGATPVFVDIEADTWCIDPEKIEAAITPATKAIIPVHIYGSMADMEKIMDIADKNNLYVIEDCAHAHGGLWDGKGVGSIGDVGSFSFQESKTLSSGEGGICLTNNEELAEKLYRIKHIGYSNVSVQGQASSGPPQGLICHNYRGTEFQAVVLSAGLSHLEEQTVKRAENAEFLEQQFKGVPGVELQTKGRLATRQGYYCLGFNIDTSAMGGNISLDDFINALAAEGVTCGKTYGPVYDHMLWNVPEDKFRKTDCNAADRVCRANAIVFNQAWLLAERETVAMLAEAIKKVALNISKNA